MFGAYLRLAVKVLLRRPFFTFVSLFGICLTLVVLTVATAILDHLLAPRAPESHSDRTLGLYDMKMTGGNWIRDGSPGYSFLDSTVRTLPGVERVSLFTNPAQVASYQTGEKVELQAKRTDGAYWRILEFEFLEGAPYTEQDDRDANPVAVINAATRDRLFGGGRAVGETITVDGQRFRVVGVVANVSSLRPDPYGDVWVPLTTAKNDAWREGMFGDFNALVLAPTHAALAGIEAELQARLATIDLPDPEHYDTLTAQLETRAETLARAYLSDDGSPRPAGRLWLALVIAALAFMLLPSVNLININVSRILERASEIGVRKAFGASSRVLVGQFIIENLVLTAIGGALGFLLSLAVLGLLRDSSLVPYAEFGLNLRVFGIGLLTMLVFGLLSGVYPAWRMSRLQPVEALRGGTR